MALDVLELGSIEIPQEVINFRRENLLKILTGVGIAEDRANACLEAFLSDLDVIRLYNTAYHQEQIGYENFAPELSGMDKQYAWHNVLREIEAKLEYFMAILLADLNINWKDFFRGFYSPRDEFEIVIYGIMLGKKEIYPIGWDYEETIARPTEKWVEYIIQRLKGNNEAWRVFHPELES